jgi:hypothetical protein
MDEISVEILKSVPSFGPVNTAQLVQKIGCPKRKVLDGLANLRAAGRIFTKIPVGHFSSESAYQTWLENGGKEYLACRGRLLQPAAILRNADAITPSPAEQSLYSVITAAFGQWKLPASWTFPTTRFPDS